MISKERVQDIVWDMRLMANWDPQAHRREQICNDAADLIQELYDLTEFVEKPDA